VLQQQSTHRSNTTLTVTAPAARPTTQLKGDALGEQIFVSGTPGGAEACGSCHTMSAATAPAARKRVVIDDLINLILRT
jgi:hypothetical protein